jgi:meso-butanediol dehydrogenase / (S,S)-butanediol dehydrogenase / diacetyl reductase
MTGRVEGRTIVVTGAGSGIGAAIASGIRDTGGRALAVHVDVTRRETVTAAVAAAADRFGRLDVWFNNAGMNSPMPFLDITEENFERIMRVNAIGVLIGTQEAAKRFIAQGGGGKVINTASIAGRTGFPSFAPYSASKAAVISLTQAAARDLAPQGITVNGFAPGVVATPLWKRLDADLAAMGAADAGFDSMAADILLGRPAQPEDIVPTALFLASGDSDYVTGQIMAIEGGMILV